MSEDMRKVIDDIKLGNYQSEPVNTNFDYEIKEKPGMFDEVMEKASKTNAYKKYFSTQADVLEEAKSINKETGIPYNAIIAGNVEKAREIYDYKKKQMDPDAVYEAYPGLGKLAQMNENDAAIALHDMENVKMVHGFFEAAKVGFDSDSLTAERNNIGLDKFMGKAVDEDRLKDIDKELEDLKEIPSLLEAPVESIVGGFAQQAPMMARNLLKGQAYGAAGAVTGFMLGAVGGGVLTGGSASPAFGLQGARIGYSVGSRVGFATEMFKESVGGYYLNYIGYKDKNGNQLLSDDEARNYAAVTALAETGIEMANFDKVLDILKGSKATLPAAKIVENIVKNAKDNASVHAQLKTWLNSNLKNFGTVALTESAEEGVQRMSEMTITKVAQILNPDGDIPDYSAEDILKGGAEAAYTALPASIGFGGSAVAASGMRFTRQAAQLMTIGKERADEALRTNTGIELVNKLMEAARTTKMGKDHKETFNNLMKANLEGTAHEKAYVDTELLMEQEGGEVVLNQLAAVAGYTEEQLKTFKETGTPIEVNTADYVSTMAGDNQINLSDYISFDAADRCLARNQRVAEEWKKLQNQVNTREVERLIENINTLTTEMFGETEERDYANQIISEYENPSAGIAERRRQIDLEIDEMIVPVIEQMRKGMRQGVGFYETDDYGNTLAPEEHDVHVGGAKFLTNNDMWYSKYYAKNRKVPTEQELRELAEEAITGSNPYGIGDFDYSDPDMVAYAEETKAQIDKLRHELELLDSIEGKLKNVDRGEFAALDALTQEGVKVYKEVADKLRAMPNKAIGRQATMGALIYAHLADRFAAAKRATGDKKYTALDFLKANPIEFGGEAEQGAYNQYGGLQEAEARLKEDEANFAKAVDLFMENKLEGQTTRVMRTPLVMELVGAQVLPVDISVRNLNKILKSKHADDITPELLKQIPRAMTDPLMIFDTYGGKQNQARKVIVLDLKTDNGATVIVPFELNAHNVPGNYTMNAVLSVYGKTDKYTGEASNVWLENQLKESKLQYINKKRASEVLDNEKLLSLIPYLKDGSSSTQIIADEEDLRKLRAMNKGFYQAAGQKAETANLAALQEAMAMYDNYEDDKAIYKKTGWYLGADGKWRFDIPDNFDKIDLSELPDAGYSVQLKDLYDNPALYKAYPWLGEALVTVGELTKGYRGVADSANNVIELSSELVKKGDREIIGIGKARFIRTKTNEETEQWQPLSGEVLSDVERMAIGMITANGNDVDKAIGEAQSEIDKSIESIKFNEANRPNSQMLQIAKQNLATNKSILETLQGIKQKGFAYTTFPFTDEEKTREEIGKTLMHEIQHLIQDNEGFARGGNPIHVHAQMRRQIDNYRRRALAIDQNAQPYYNRKRDWEAAIIEGASPEKIQVLQKELSFLEDLVPEEKRQPIIDLLGEADRLERQLKESINPFYDYQNLHGEQEARAASRKAEINTKIKQLETIEVKTLDKILANNIEKVFPENQAAIREWIELNKKFDEATIEEVKKLNERQSEIEAQVKDDEGAQAFFSEYDENFEAEWNKNDIGNLERDYTEEVLEGVSPYNAIVVFGGDVVSGYAVGPKGQTKIKSNGQKVIRLFETADESTFIHEMGHVAYENLRELASQENAPAQFKRDIKTLDNWANWKEGQIDEYVGTATYKEFAARDNAIKEAMASGDEALAEQLKYEWRQERFARGWEEYLKKGKAPTEGLRKVFYQFKKWLTSIYKAYRAIGGAPTKEVEDVMKRMLLTDEAIELAEKKAEIEAFEKSGAFDYLGNDSSKSMWQKILEEIRAEASAKVMKIAMKDMSETAKLEREEKINAEREATRQRMAKEPVWAIYSTLKYNPKASVSAVCKAFNMTVEEYANALKANGGTFERAVDNYMQIYTAELKAPNKQEIEARAEEAVTTSYYKQLLDAFELELLQRKIRQEVRLSKKIAGIVAETEEERAAQEKALRELDKKAEEARSQKALRDVAVGNVETIKNYARQKMAVMPIEYSANPTVWKNASRQKAAEMTAALAKKDYGKAVQAAKMRLTYDAMTDIATENKLFVDRKSKKMRDRAKTVRREKNMAADERYVYFHLLYAFGLAERDVPIPPGYKGFVDTVIAYKEARDYGLENMSVSFVNNEGQLMMSDFIINAGTGEAVYRKGISELTVSEFKELNDVMDNLYAVAVEANKIKTVTGEDGKTVTIEDAIKEMEEDIAKRRKEPEIKDPTNAGNIHTWDSILDIGNKFHLSLIKAETLLEEMGAAFTKYLYDPIKHAAEKELEMTVEYAKKIEEIKQAWYDGKVVKYMNQGMTEDEARKAADKEFKEMYTAEKYKLGTSTLTKENILAFALNWGTEANRDRALNYGGTTKAAFERIFAELDGADWQFVMNVWDLFDETWPQVKEVEARVSGVTLEKQEGIAFTITGKDGATYAIQGKYYPIKYDPKKTAKAETYQKEEGLRSKLPSMARMGVGVGMTKERAVKTNYLIRNDLGVFGEAINENIHLITMREAVRDVSRIINDAQFVALMERYMGKNVVPMLQAWALDCWQVEPKVKGELEEAMAYVRKKQTMAVLGFRASTALMNVANLAPVTNYLGAARTWDALTSFYAHPQDQYDFVMERSPFMNNRAQTMDRDMRDVIKNKGIMGKKLDWIEQKAFVMLTQSDLMLANPLWLSEYQRVYRENVDKGLAPSVIERMAVDAGDKAVRTVFGSGMVQDLAAVQKGGEVTKMLTMFYSYFSVVYQAISRAYYERRRRIINKEDWLKRNAPVLDLILYWFILPSAMIVATKMGMAWATGDDDEEFTVKNFLIKTGAESLNTAAGTIPILRDVSSMALTYLTEGRYYGARSTPIGELEENVMDVIRSIKGYAEDKKDVDDVVRAVLRGTAYATGLPVVGADGIATIMQWFEYGDATPEEIWQYLAAIMAGKRVEK